jgi:hypothetical protein
VSEDHGQKVKKPGAGERESGRRYKVMMRTSGQRSVQIKLVQSS